jgi:hypothetical protein
MSSKFDLCSYDDVARWSDAILAMLRDGSMPCDGAWSEEQVARFQEWVAAEKSAWTSSREDPGGRDPWFDWCDRAARQAALTVEVFSPRQRRNNGGRHGPKR